VAGVSALLLGAAGCYWYSQSDFSNSQLNQNNDSDPNSDHDSNVSGPNGNSSPHGVGVELDFPLEQVELQLRAAECSVHFAMPQGVVSGFHVNAFQANRSMEDARREVVLPADPYEGITSSALFGVYDGHGGARTANFLAEELFDYIAYAKSLFAVLLSHSASSEAEHTANENHESSATQVAPAADHGARTDAVVSDDDNDQDTSPQGIIPYCLKHAFLQADDIYLQRAAITHQYRSGFCGACAVVAYIQDRYAYVANAGDCRAVVGRYSEKDEGTHKVWTAIPVSKIHRADIKEERQRLRAEHPNEDDVDALRRVKGMLEPTRAFGDGIYKSHFWNDLVPDPSKRFQEPYTPPYITAQPDVQIHEISGNDRFMILASDGLWDFVSPTKAVRIVTRAMEAAQKDPDAPFNAATELIRYVMQKRGAALLGDYSSQSSSSDEKIAAVMQIPHGTRRLVMDDITATVIWLDRSNLDEATEMQRFHAHLNVPKPASQQEVETILQEARAQLRKRDNERH